MNILFISISSLSHLSGHGISLDLLRQLKNRGHSVYAVCSNQRREGKKTTLSDECGCKVLRVKTGNLTKTNVIEKGISNLLLPYQYTAAIKRYFKGVKFDLILYPTPPVTQLKTVEYIKKRDNAKTYLLLKDIFPQNAVDIGMMTKKGAKSIIYKMFRKKEEGLYRVSDYIGCMSQANVDYILKHNPEINPEIVHINPNSREVVESALSEDKKAEIKAKYGIPENAATFIYGGNLGRPQGIPFLIECLKANKDKRDRFFVICGTGTDYGKLKAYYDAEKPQNVLLLNGLPKEEYEEFVKAFDVGLIFLDHRFTIPNFPSRLLSYMQSKMPVIACTDPNTDIGKVAEEGGFGISCESNDPANFTAAVDEMLTRDLKAMGEKAFTFLTENYTADKSCEIILKHI
ncbi:MAG: glycosyltransferase family 4 protein [Clostridia bacterium]|nr:glycosyltransferase family 4 protein [Clostridia bacterium]